MRIRQVKPEFWKDEPISRLSDGARLFYIGLWQIGDDSGWLRWNVSEIGAELYPYRARPKRERDIERFAHELIHLDGMPRLVIHDCGHAVTPKTAKHQHLAGTTRRVETIRKEHELKCIPATNRDTPPIPATPRTVSNGSDGDGQGGAGGLSEKRDDDQELTDEDRANIEYNRAILTDDSKPEAVKRGARKFLLSRGIPAA